MSDPGTNTSATGGPMLPSVPPAPFPLEGIALLDIIQETLVALSGIATDNVRPRFQSEPPNIPDRGTSWLSFGIQSRPSDTNVVIQHDGAAAAGEGQDNFQRQEELMILCSFYDDGSTGEAYMRAAMTRDGFTIPQNMEALQADGIYWGYSGELTQLPSLLKTQWLYRVDLSICLRRQVNRAYRILNLLSAQAQIIAGAGDPIGMFIIGESEIAAILVVDISITPASQPQS